MSEKFIYFDVGGVVIKDFSGTNKWTDLIRSLGIPSEQNNLFDELYDRYTREINTVRDIETLVPMIKQKFEIDLPEDYSLLVEFVKRFEKNSSIWPLIDKAKKKYKVGLLTNMYPRMFEMIKEYDLLPDVHWDAVVDSSIVKLQKPDRDIYEKAEELCGFSGSEILFIDNTQKHLDGAKKLGWETFLYDPSNITKSNTELNELISQSY